MALKNNKNIKNKYIIIHKVPLFERIFGLISSFLLLLIPITCLCLGFEDKLKIIIILIALLILLFIMYLNAFKMYICFDIVNKKITISEGLKKEKLSTFGLMSITVENDKKYPKLFSLNYNFIVYSMKDYGWSTGPSSRVMFGSIKTQRKRLEKFCDECNMYLDNK